MSLLIGTSGWAYPEWQPAVYPPGLPRGRFLEHYATVLTACEVNGTFHRLQSRDAVTRWAEAVPEGFRFVPKMHRGVVRAARLPAPGAGTGLLEAFLDSVGALGTRLGAVLLTFHTRPRDDEGLRGLLACLPAGMRPVLDLRDPSWDPETAARIAAGHGGTLCVTEADGGPPGPLPGGDLLYVRLRGERYPAGARAAWAAALAREAERREVYAITRHEGLPADDPHCGVGLALWLREQVSAPPEDPPGAG